MERVGMCLIMFLLSLRGRWGRRGVVNGSDCGVTVVIVIPPINRIDTRRTLLIQHTFMLPHHRHHRRLASIRAISILAFSLVSSAAPNRNRTTFGSLTILTSASSNTCLSGCNVTVMEDFRLVLRRIRERLAYKTGVLVLVVLWSIFVFVFNSNDDDDDENIVTRSCSAGSAYKILRLDYAASTN